MLVSSSRGYTRNFARTSSLTRARAHGHACSRTVPSLHQVMGVCAAWRCCSLPHAAALTALQLEQTLAAAAAHLPAGQMPLQLEIPRPATAP